MKSVVLLRSLLHNIGVMIIGFGFASLGRALDFFSGIARFHSVLITAVAVFLLIIGFLFRVWATYLFYEEHMNVISFIPQTKLITSGPYCISRNPLYLGGNVFIFLGAVLFLGSPIGIALTVLNIVVVDIIIRREEKQLAREFGDVWVQYRNRVSRWL